MSAENANSSLIAAIAVFIVFMGLQLWLVVNSIH
jgi:hypothetical protein